MNLKSSPWKVSPIYFRFSNSLSLSLSRVDWNDVGAAGKQQLATAFTEDWDDEVIEEDFAKQLRAEIQKLGK